MRYEYEFERGISITVDIADPFNLTDAEKAQIVELLDGAICRTPDDFWVEKFPDLPRERWPLFVSAGSDVIAEFHPVSQ